MSSEDRLCGSGNIGREIWVVNIALFLLAKQGNCFPFLQTGLCAWNYPCLWRGITSMWGKNRRFINHKLLQISKNNSNYLDTHGKPLGIEAEAAKPPRARTGLSPQRGQEMPGIEVSHLCFLNFPSLFLTSYSKIE